MLSVEIIHFIYCFSLVFPISPHVNPMSKAKNSDTREAVLQPKNAIRNKPIMAEVNIADEKVEYNPMIIIGILRKSTNKLGDTFTPKIISKHP